MNASNTKQWDLDAAEQGSPTQPEAAQAPLRAITPTLGVAIFVLVVDQLTKRWALGELSAGRTIDLLGSLRFNLHFNDGAAFSTGGGFGPLFGLAALVVSVWLVFYARKHESLLLRVVLGLIAGGAIGNVADRAFRRGDGGILGGYVIDFIDLGWWPIFNVADMAIVAGVAAMMVALVRNPDL